MVYICYKIESICNQARDIKQSNTRESEVKDVFNELINIYKQFIRLYVLLNWDKPSKAIILSWFQKKEYSENKFDSGDSKYDSNGFLILQDSSSMNQNSRKKSNPYLKIKRYIDKIDRNFVANSYFSRIFSSF